MSKCYLLLVLVLATAFGRTDSAPIDADDHQTCLGYGFTPGNRRICRLQDAPAKITLRSNSYRTMGERIPGPQQRQLDCCRTSPGARPVQRLKACVNALMSW